MTAGEVPVGALIDDGWNRVLRVVGHEPGGDYFTGPLVRCVCLGQHPPRVRHEPLLLPATIVELVEEEQ